MIQIFKAFVRPHLEYTNSVWSPFHKNDILLIENVHRRAAKLITEQKDISYEERLRRLNLPSLVNKKILLKHISTHTQCVQYQTRTSCQELQE